MHYTKETAQETLENRMGNLITDAHVGTIVNKTADGKPLKVLRVSEPMLDQNGNNIRIVNLPILNEYYANQAQEAFSAGEYDEACNSTMTYTIFLDDKDGNPKKDVYVPSNGSPIGCHIGSFTTKDGETAISIGSLIAPKEKAMSTFKFNFGADATETEEDETLEAVIGKKK